MRDHFPHNPINEFSISNIDQVNHLYNFLVHEPGTLVTVDSFSMAMLLGEEKHTLAAGCGRSVRDLGLGLGLVLVLGLPNGIDND